MSKQEAMRIATEHLRTLSELRGCCQPDPTDAFLVEARFRLEPDAASDAWVVHFPRILPPGVLLQEPDTVGIQVDVATCEAKVVPLL
ncbi:MAG: hypothetical protein K2X82_18445 [Gemmataceae bacterium]|nr:hypothetical protein [Gemmataceae bacterium]